MKNLLTSCFGLGWLPGAPGTWGSLPVALLFALMFNFGVSVLLVSSVMAVLTLAGSIICVKYAPAVVIATGKTDPPEIVADEFAGQALTFLSTGFWVVRKLSFGQFWIVAGLGFLLFRIFDIAKPWPIRRLEKLPKGWGILADDLLAGVFAAISLQIFIHLWFNG